MTEHHLALTLALLIVAERCAAADATALEYATHTVLARLLTDWSDERKADLYALIEERVKAEHTIGQMRSLISECLWKNESWAQRHG